MSALREESIPRLRAVDDTRLDISSLEWASEYSAPKSQAELIERARQVAPLLIPLQAEVERRNHYCEDVHQLFKNAGFYRTLVPKKYDGYEYSYTTFLRIVTEVMSGCANTGWQLCLGSSHALQIGTYMSEEGQDDLFASPDFIVPGTVVPSGQAEMQDDGGMKLSGIFRYCSGVPYGSHFIGHTFVNGGLTSFVAAKEDYKIMDDWGATLGMKGSGSQSIEIKDAIIPAKFMKPVKVFGEPMLDQNTNGLRLHNNKMYAGSSICIALLSMLALGVGMAKNAQRTFEELMETKKTTFAPIVPRKESPMYQMWYGEAVGKVESAEAILISATDRWMENCELGKIGMEDDMRILGLCREGINLAWESMSEVFFRAAGSSEIMRGKRMERIWRDASTHYSHNGNVFFLEASKSMLAQARFGVAPSGAP